MRFIRLAIVAPEFGVPSIHIAGALRLSVAMLVIVALVLASSAGSGATYTWQSASGDWSDASNWGGTPPSLQDTALIDNGGTATITTTGPNCGVLTVGDGSGAGSLLMTAGALDVYYDIYCGQSGAGAFTQSGGTISSVIASTDLALGSNAGTGTYNLTGGSLGIAGVESVGYAGTGVFTQSGGTNSAGGWISVGGYVPNGNGSYALSGGLLSAGFEWVGEMGNGAFTQSGGTNSTSQLGVGRFSGCVGTFGLSGSGLLTAPLQFVGCSGTGALSQSGGTNSATSLYLGYNSGSNGTYNLSGGSLSATREYVGYDPAATATFAQSGGNNSTAYLSIGNGGRYLLAGGTLQLTGTGAYLSAGMLDGGNAAGALSTAASSIVDLSQGIVANAGTMVLNVGPGSLLILPAGTSPANFGAVNGPGMYYTRGTPLAVSAGSGFAGTGTINDSVDCQGTIQALNGPLNLNAGLTVSGTGSVNLGSGTLTTQDATSGISGGSLTAGCQSLAPSGTGVFTQSGGLSTINVLSIGSGGRYVLSGGTLQIPQGGLALAGTLDGGNAASVLNVAGSAIVDLSQGSFANTGSTSLSIGPNSLLIISSTSNPAPLLGQFSNAGMTHVAGTALTVSAGSGFAGSGAIADPVDCQGWISSAGGPIAFAGGLTIEGSGSVNLPGNTLVTENVPSSLAGGLLFASTHCVGMSGVGAFMQSGGSNSSSNLCLGYNPGSSGNYGLGGGLLSADNVSVGYSGTGMMTQSGGTNSTYSLSLGGNSRGRGTYNLDGGLLQTFEFEYIGNSGTGDFTQSGGTNYAPYNLYLGYSPGTHGSYDLSGGSIWAYAGYVGYSGTGIFTQSSGTNATYCLYVSYLSSSSGTYSLSGGLLSSYTEYLGNGLSGTLVQSGGTNSAGNLYVRSSGIYDLSGGSLSAYAEYVGEAGIGTFVQSGGTNSVGGGGLHIGATNSSGTYDLSGGLLKLSALSGYHPTFAFSGGTMTAAASFSTNVPISLPTSGGTATFNTAGYSMTLNGLVTGPGGISKLGSGYLVLNAADSYRGDTAILAGTLQLGSAVALQNSTVDLMMGGTLNLNGYSATLGGLSGSGNLALGGGTLTVGNNSASTTYAGNLSGAGSLKKIGSGALTLAGSNGYSGKTSVASGTLIASTTAAVPNLLVASPKVSIAAGATLAVGVGGAGQWTGANIDSLRAKSGVFASGANLGFDTSGGSFTYASNISNVGLGLVKLGPNALVLSGSNTYSGGTIVSGGTLEIVNPWSLPDGGSLTVGAAQAFAAPAAKLVVESVAVPEPGALALLAAMACGAAVFCRERSRHYERLTSVSRNCAKRPDAANAF